MNFDQNVYTDEKTGVTQLELSTIVKIGTCDVRLSAHPAALRSSGRSNARLIGTDSGTITGCARLIVPGSAVLDCPILWDYEDRRIKGEITSVTPDFDLLWRVVSALGGTRADFATARYAVRQMIQYLRDA